MYGVLLAETSSGEHGVLKAFSGLLNGCSQVEGWVPPIPGRDEIALEEARVLQRLEAIKQELLALQQRPERQQYDALSQVFETRLRQLTKFHHERKQERQQQRQRLSATQPGDALIAALEQLDEQSRQDGIERRRLKQERDAALNPLRDVLEQTDVRIRELKQQRKALSRQLQIQMHATYRLTNFAGQSLSIQDVIPNAMPTGTGDCCAPKLLHYAATHGLKPLAMAEFWWGSTSVNGDKIQGEFYGACTERCQPLMGFLLSGLSGLLPTPIAPPGSSAPLSILYEDEWLIVVNKPAGLLSVPGRYADRQDSVLSRLRHTWPDGERLMAVHRLDQDTSGILLLARDLQTYRLLSRQFQQRQVHKVYEAVLAGLVAADSGVIDLPLWSDPGDRPYQKVDEQRGKPSLTTFRVLSRDENTTRIEFIPKTGRTHQLRVHAADAKGLGIPILGDRLYGVADSWHSSPDGSRNESSNESLNESSNGARLYLHARELIVIHPYSWQTLHLRVDTPF